MKERFRCAPSRGAPQALSFSRNFLGFVTDSSRSYAKWFMGLWVWMGGGVGRLRAQAKIRFGRFNANPVGALQAPDGHPKKEDGVLSLGCGQ